MGLILPDNYCWSLLIAAPPYMLAISWMGYSNVINKSTGSGSWPFSDKIIILYYSCFWIICALFPSPTHTYSGNLTVYCIVGFIINSTHLLWLLPKHIKVKCQNNDIMLVMILFCYVATHYKCHTKIIKLAASISPMAFLSSL
jgi:hypothetical protein